jgi:hypothetical protein
MSKKDKLYEYLDEVIYAKLDGKAKTLLFFYATVYNWTKDRPSFWSERAICALTGMAPSTYQAKRNYLEDLGWIVVKKRGREMTSLVGVMVGRDDPNYESNCWAKWHPYNNKLEVDTFWDGFPVKRMQKPGSEEMILKVSRSNPNEVDDMWGIFESR